MDASSGLIWRIAGPTEDILDHEEGFSGDNGPAREARLAAPDGLALSDEGDLFIADVNSNRNRVIYRCRDVSPPSLTSPADGSSGLSTTPRLGWREVDGAFRYDVYLDNANPPTRRIANDI